MSKSINRRQALQWAGYAGLGWMSANYWPELTCAAETRPGGPLGVALCIGVNEVNPTFYRGWRGRLAGCENDCHDMAAVAKGAGFKVRKLITRDATKANVGGSLKRAAAGLMSGDILLVTYSGHGSYTRDTNGDEPDDHRDETWCLFDGQVIDDELASIWANFQPGVRVIVFADSCHSGSSTRATDSANLAELSVSNDDKADEARNELQEYSKLQSSMDKIVLTQKELDQLNAAPSPIRAMPESVAEMLATAADKGPAVPVSIVPNEKQSLRETQATVLLISGCQDNQTSLDTGRNGLFTRTFLEIWQANSGTITDYRDLHSRILHAMPPYQSPNYFVFGGSNPAFELQKPFTV